MHEDMEQLKIDLAKSDTTYCKIGNTPDIRNLDSYYYLTIQGKSSPGGQGFLHAIEAIYAVT